MATVGGLFWYEIVLLVLGAVFFLVLLGALRKALAGDKSYVGLLPFFLVSIAMMGYPSITSIQYKDGMVEIENDTNQIANNPGDPQNAVRSQALETKLNELTSRATGGDAQKIARARDVLQSQPGYLGRKGLGIRGNGNPVSHPQPGATGNRGDGNATSHPNPQPPKPPKSTGKK